MKLRARRLTAQQAVKVLAAFCAAHGPEVIRNAYGWRQPPANVTPGERMYAFAAEGDDMVGWGTIHLNTRNAEDDEAVLAVGVFPGHERKGYRVAILDWLVFKAEQLGADRASMIVKKSNEAHYNRTMREVHTPGSRWVYAGDVWFPAPGYGYFVCPLTKEEEAA